MIITDEALLRPVCSDVLPEDVGALVRALETELDASARAGCPGVGLAAPQIGIAKKAAIVRVPGANGKMITINLVNCKIEKRYDKTFFENEGCLSFPGRVERTMRYQEIYVLDNLVEPHSFIATGLLAVVVQHELNHLEGILLPDEAVK